MTDNINPLVSVLMPTYKHEHFIRRAIASLLDQTLQNWELFIINDGSPDATEEVIQDYLHDKRIQYYTRQHNTGLGSCLNFGLSEAKGIYITYLPSDDVIYKDHFQSLYEAFQQNEEAVLAYSSVRHFYNRKTEGIINKQWYQTCAGNAQKD